MQEWLWWALTDVRDRRSPVVIANDAVAAETRRIERDPRIARRRLRAPAGNEAANEAGRVAGERSAVVALYRDVNLPAGKRDPLRQKVTGDGLRLAIKSRIVRVDRDSRKTASIKDDVGKKWCQPPNLGKWPERDRRDPPPGRLRRVGLQPERGEGRRPVQAPSERPDDRSTRLRRRARERRAGRDAHGEGEASCRTRSAGV